VKIFDLNSGLCESCSILPQKSRVKPRTWIYKYFTNITSVPEFMDHFAGRKSEDLSVNPPTSDFMITLNPADPVPEHCSKVLYNKKAAAAQMRRVHFAYGLLACVILLTK
jgi:hypothetical protein